MLMYLKQERDHGTPARTSTETVQLNIDGYDVSVPKGTSLMRAAVEAPAQWGRVAVWVISAMEAEQVPSTQHLL